jgi:hypothetical protein
MVFTESLVPQCDSDPLRRCRSANLQAFVDLLVLLDMKARLKVRVKK